MSNKIKKRKKKKKSGIQTLRLPKKSASHVQNIAQIMQLASQYYRAGNLPQAVQLYRQILQAGPQNTDALNGLGNALQLSGKLDEALACYTKAVHLQPNIAEFHANLGLLLQAMGRPNEAVTSFNKALAIKPEFAEVYIGLGNVFQESNMLARAIDCYKKAISIKPDNVEALYNLGLAYKEGGMMDEAVFSLKKTLMAKPDYGVAHRTLAEITKYTEYDEEVRAMEELYFRDDLPNGDKMHLGFALGKIFEDLRQYDRSFGFISEANRLKRGSYRYSIDSDRDLFTKIKEVFSADFFISYQGAGYPDDTPIFIVGMPRSGTTLVEQILASHPLVFGAGELTDFEYLTKNFCADTGEEFPKCFKRVDQAVFEGMGSDYIKRIRKYSEEARYITDKMPHNFLRVGLIKVILPQAKIIHCRRNPMDNCLSLYKNYFAAQGSHEYAYDQNELGIYYRLYLDLMAHWDNVLPGFMYSLKYEDMVSDQKNQTEKLLEFCGLPWDEACLAFHKTERRVQTASVAQVRKPIYTDSVELWRRYETQLEPLYKSIHAE